MTEKQVQFKGTIDKFLFKDNDDISRYKVELDWSDYSKLRAKYNVVIIFGDLPYLKDKRTYKFKANEIYTEKYGFQYEITEVEDFNLYKKDLEILKEFVSENLAKKINEVYPDFIDDVLNDREVVSDDIKGMGEKKLKSLKEKIKEEYEDFELFDDFKGFFKFSIIHKMNEYINEENISKQSYLHLFDVHPYEALCSLHGVGFKRADEIIEGIIKGEREQDIIDKDILESDERIEFALTYFITEEMKRTGNTYVELSKMGSDIAEFIKTERSVNLNKILNSSLFKLWSEDKIRYITLSDMANKEAYIYNVIRAVTEKDMPVLGLEKTKYRKLGEFELTEEQLSLIDAVNEEGIVIFNGYAGSGKTSSLQNLIRALRDKELTYKLMAPTGKAAKVLKNYTGEDASTIHMGLMYQGAGKFMLNEFVEDVIIVDEATMMDTELMFYLLKAIKFSKSRLLLIGDDAQLPSVGPGNIFSDLLKLSNLKKVSLTKIFRYGEGGIDTIATKIRNGDLYLDDNVVYDSYNFINLNKQEAIDTAIAKYEDLILAKNEFSDILFLTFKRKYNKYNPDNASTTYINEVLQERINTYGEEIIINGNYTGFKTGDYVMYIKNNYKANLILNDYEEDDLYEMDETTITNGTTGIIKDYNSSGIFIEFDNELIFVPVLDLNNITLSYAITIHKSQGSQAKNVIILTPKDHGYFLRSNTLYVGITRATENCYHYGDKDMLNVQSKIFEQNNRKTILQKLLSEPAK